MARLWLALICAVVYGTIAVLVMIPLHAEEASRAMAAAFANRFGIGLVVALAPLRGTVPWWLEGLGFGLLLSLPDAIITRAWAPILGMGAVGGLIVAFVAMKWAAGPKMPFHDSESAAG